MSGNRYTLNVKRAVEKLRGSGHTYAEIQKTFPIPKSTLSAWLGEKYAGIFDKAAQIKHLERIRKISAAKLRRDKIARDAVHRARGAVVAKSLPLHDISFQKALLAMLYWAEGTKNEKNGVVVFANTDPLMMLLYITMLRNCFVIDEPKLRARLHLHYYHKKKESVRFWSELLNIPTSQFGKLYIKKRSKSRKFRQNFKGICFVIYSNTGFLKEILTLGKTIAEHLAPHDSSRPESN